MPVLSEAAAIAIAGAVRAVAELVALIAAGQPEDVRRDLWTWYRDDVARMRKLFGLDAAP